MVKISKKTREQAALICAIAASGGVHTESPDRWTRVYCDIARALDYDCVATRLSILAYDSLMRGRTWTRELDAEAESMIRTGWSPGDEP